VVLETRPAVIAVDEAGIERGRQPRMSVEVADTAQTQPRRRVAAHGQGVGIGEAERVADDEPARSYPRPQRWHGGHRGIVQDRATDCAGVLGVEVDLAAGHCAVDHARPAEPEPALHWRLADLLGDPGHDLGDQVTLGKRFGAHAHRRGAPVGGPGERRRGDGEHRSQSVMPRRHARAPPSWRPAELARARTARRRDRPVVARGRRMCLPARPAPRSGA